MINSKSILEGIVEESLPDTTFKIKLNKEERTVLAHLSGKMRIHYIRILPGDRVLIELSPYDKNRGRIIRRL